MKPASFRLPSNSLDCKLHDCRIEALKYKFADKKYDAHVLTKYMTAFWQAVSVQKETHEMIRKRRYVMKVTMGQVM